MKWKEGLIGWLCSVCSVRWDSCEGYLRWSLWNGFILQGLKGLHGRVVSGSLASPPLSDKLVVPHCQLHIKYLRHWVMVPKFGREPRDREGNVEWKRKRQVKGKKNPLIYKRIILSKLGSFISAQTLEWRDTRKATRSWIEHADW